MRSTFWAAAAVCVAALAGCVGPVPGDCQSDADCGAGEYCSARSRSCILKVEAEAVCDPACAAHQQCEVDACVDRYEALDLTSPGAGATVLPDTQVPVTAELTLAEGRGAQPPAELTLEVVDPTGAASTVSLAPSGESTFEGTLAVGSGEGPWMLRAVWEEAELTSPEVTLTVDATAPTFELSLGMPPQRPQATATTDWEDPQGNAFRRDEALEVTVTSEDADVDPSSVALAVSIAGGPQVQVPVAEAQACAKPAVYCGTASVDLSAPEMNAFRGEVSVALRGADLVGNQATPVPGTRPVTRWKWVYTLDTNPIRASPAIALDGTVIVGSSNSATLGKLGAVRPDGTEKWTPKPLGAVSASPAVGATGIIYVAVQDDTTGAGMWAYDPSGAQVGTSPCRPNSQGVVEASPFITRTQISGETGDVETAATVVRGATSWLVTHRPTAAAACLNAVVTAGVGYPGALSGQGLDAWYGDESGNLQGFTFGASGWAAKPGWPVSDSLFASALAFVGGEVVGGGGPGQGGLFSVPEAGGASKVWEAPTGSPAWNPSVGAGGVGVVGLSDQTLLAVPLGATTVPSPVGTDGAVKTAPLFGEGGRLFLASETGTLMSRDVSAPDVDLWKVGGLGGILASPTLDCTRDAGGQKVPGAPGVLYVGAAGKLHAFVVDSRGIDVDAPWPKYQHDPRNTGNAQTPLAPFACP